jgi:hypothetical protein
MRKIGFFIRNIYRVLVVKSDGERMVMNYPEAMDYTEKDILSEALLKKIIAADDCCIETNVEMQKMLEQRVAKNGSASTIARNSILEMFLPVFSLKNFELKMAVISLALLITLGIGPANNHSVNRSFSPFFLADTLRDSSVLNLPIVHDSVFEINCK